MKLLGISLLVVLVGLTLGHEGHDHSHDHEHSHDHNHDEEDHTHSSSSESDEGHSLGIQWKNRLLLTRPTGVDVRWNDTNNEYLIIEMSSWTTGYVSVGFCPIWKGTMEGCDIVLGWVDHEGKAHLKDMYANGNETPLEDNVQDVELLMGLEEEGHTLLRFKRPWKTSDVNGKDANLERDKVQIIWAWHPVDPEQKDGSMFYPPHDVNSRGHTHKMVHFKHFEPEEDEYEHDHSERETNGSNSLKNSGLFGLFLINFLLFRFNF